MAKTGNGAARADDEADLRAAVRRLTDRAEIIDLFANFATAANTRDRAALSELFTPDVVMAHTATQQPDPGAQWVGADTVTRRMVPEKGGDLAMHRVITDHRIELRGDEASVTVSLLAIRADADAADRQNVKISQGWYLTEVVRTEDGWKIRWLLPATWKALSLPVADALIPAHLDAMRTAVRDHGAAERRAVVRS